LDSVEDMERAAESLKARGVSIVRGIGKHGRGENMFLVFKNRQQRRNLLRDQADTERPAARVWERNIEPFDQWRFASFVVPPPQAVIEQKKRKKYQKKRRKS
jgi:Glyoxalase/Bleomycin resistance protein/Dioxygenase superfamily